MTFKSILIFLPFISMLGESDQRHQSGIRLNISEYTLSDLGDLSNLIRGTQREYSLKPLKHSIVKRILVFKR